MAFSYIFDVEAASTNNNSVTTGNVDSTGATFIAIECNHDNASAIIPSNAKGNVPDVASTRYKSNAPGTNFYGYNNPTVGANDNWTLTATGNYPSCGVIGFSTSNDVSVDQQNGATTAGSSSLASGSITPSANDALIVTGSSQNSNSSVSPQTSPYTNTAALNTTSNAYGTGMAYEIQTTATARNVTWAWSAGAIMTSVVLSFLEDTAPAANQNYLTLLGVG